MELTEADEEEKTGSSQTRSANASRREYDSSPMDKGWAWLMLLGSCIVGAVILAVIKSQGVFYTEWLQRLQTSPTATAWIISIRGVAPIIGGLLSGYIIDIVSYLALRRLLIGAVLVYVVVFIIGGSVTHFFALVFFFGFIGGSCSIFLITVALSISSKCFKARSRLAMGLFFCANSIGGAIAPIFVTEAISHYGYLGAFILFAGLLLQMLPFAFTFGHWHNLEQRWKKQQSNTEGGEGSAEQSSANQSESFRRKIFLLKACYHVLEVFRSYRDYLKTPKVPIPTIASAILLLCQMTQYMVLPAFGLQIGLSPEQAAIAPGLANISEIPSRIILGIVLDKKLVQERFIYIFNGCFLSLLTGLASAIGFLIPLEYRFTVLCVYCVLFGVFGSTSIMLYLSTVRGISEQLMGRAAGLVGPIGGLALLLGPILLGGLFSMTGYYATVFVFCAISYAVTSTICIVHIILQG